jgi:hypothetical protein
MGAVLLDPTPVAKRPAREVVVATRLPKIPEVGEYRTPWDSPGDVVAECAVDGCGYGCSGPRAEVGKAMKAHHALYHSQSIGVVLLNHPRQ